jgi:hypothetical protein
LELIVVLLLYIFLIGLLKNHYLDSYTMIIKRDNSFQLVPVLV